MSDKNKTYVQHSLAVLAFVSKKKFASSASFVYLDLLFFVCCYSSVVLCLALLLLFALLLPPTLPFLKTIHLCHSNKVSTPHTNTPSLCQFHSLVLQRLRGKVVLAQRVPVRHQQVHHFPEHVPPHPTPLGPTPHPKEESQHFVEFAVFLLLLLVLAARHRQQLHVRQGLAPRQAALQRRRCHSAAGGGEGEAGLDEEGGLVRIRGLFKEADGDEALGFLMSKVGQGRLRITVTGDIRGSTNLEKELGNRCYFPVYDSGPFFFVFFVSV